MYRGLKGKHNSIPVFVLVASLVCGCSSSVDPASADDNPSQAEADVELIEPAGTVLKFETAQYRDISHVSTYQGVVCPNTIEYSYESDQPFGNYSYLPGDTVNTGDLLFYGAVDGIDDSIDDVMDENSSILEDFNDYVSDYLIDIAKAKKNEFEAASAYQSMKNNEPSEDSPYYMGWAKGVMPLESSYKQAKMAREKMEQAYKERCELFDLEYAYNEQRILRLEEKKAAAGVNSTIDGVVVATNYYYPGDTVTIGSDILAVGDPADKEIVCEYISKSIVNKAAEIYAIVNGKRLDVVYENMEPEEYRRLKQKNDEVYTTFKLAQDSDEIALGQYAVIVVVEKKTENVLCVPKDSVSKDENGFYVYLYKDGDSVYTPVTIGDSDNGFMQITGGLAEGDKVVYDAPYDLGSKTETVKSGEVHVDFTADGYLMYPNAEWMTNPSKNGVCYLNELCVDQFEQVSEGQVLARIEVVADTVEIDRIRRKIQRQNERIADLNTKKKTTYNEEDLESLDRAIRDRNRTIEDLNRQLEKLGKYSGIVEIKAPYSGLITARGDYKAGQIINYGDKLVQVAANDSCYIVVDDKGGMLSFGDEAMVTSKDNTGNVTEFPGTVVSLNPWGLSKDMRTGYALIKVAQENMSAMTGLGSDNNNGYWFRIRFTVKAPTKTMENVLLIPKSAVYKTGNDTYVITKGEDGMTKLIKFVAGGSDNANYWVAYGDITEGMSICYG